MIITHNSTLCDKFSCERHEEADSSDRVINGFINLIAANK